METAIQLNQKTQMIGPAENPILKRLAKDFAPDPRVECAECRDRGEVSVKAPYRGKTVWETRKCDCFLRKVRRKKLEIIPPEFADCALDTLRPMPDIHPKQTEYVELLKEKPTAKYIIAGDFGTGKTHFFWTLYAEAVRRDRRVWAGTARALISDFQKAIELSQAGERYIPALTAENLRQSREPYSVFLDDLDKARATEYAAEQLFEIVNAAYEFSHQVVVTTNLSVANLETYYERADKNRGGEGFGRYGGAIVRRLLDKAHRIEMF